MTLLETLDRLERLAKQDGFLRQCTTLPHTEILRLCKALRLARGALEDVSKEEYIDSDTKSLFTTLKSMSRHTLAQINALFEEEKK